MSRLTSWARAADTQARAMKKPTVCFMACVLGRFRQPVNELPNSRATDLRARPTLGYVPRNPAKTPTFFAAGVDRMPSVDEHFPGKADAVRDLYHRLLAMAETFGPVVEDPKKTAIPLNRRTAFAGIPVRKEPLVLRV